VVLSLEVYIFAPALQRDLAAAAPAAAAALPAVAAALALALVSQQSVVLTSALVCALAFITLLCPMWLVRIHKFKAQINGPWDEAAPRLFSALGQQS
jgi:phosphatidylinositol glycan class C protein